MTEGALDSPSPHLMAEARPPGRAPAIAPNGVVAMSILVLTEVMFFTAFISAYRIVSAGVENWPPPDHPRFATALTAVNTVILLASGVFVFLAHRADAGRRRGVAGRLLITGVVLGAVFVVIQGSEWARLLHYGLTVSSSTYSGFFYLIIGAHAVHAVAALIAWAILLPRFLSGTATANQFIGTQIFWYFVVAIWPPLYYTVYFT